MDTKLKRAESRKGKDGRPQKYHQHGKPSTKSLNTPSVNPLKSKIRDAKRLLDYSEHLPPGVRIEKERALVGYKQDLEKAIEEKHRNQMIGKYHMVRFFERKKASRNLKKFETRLAKAEPLSAQDREELQGKIHAAKVDVNYALYYPLTEKYISLFPRTEEYEDQGKAAGSREAGKPPVWAFVEQCMQSSRLNMLREGKLNVKPDGSIKTREDIAPETRLKNEAAKKKKIAASEKKAQAGGDGDESDGGFFEK